MCVRDDHSYCKSKQTLYLLTKLLNVLHFAGGDSSGGRQTRNGVAVCSQKRALCVTAIVLAALLGTALVIAYVGPQTGL